MSVNIAVDVAVIIFNHEVKGLLPLAVDQAVVVHITME